MVDVDNFKSVNDVLGHSVGDGALQVLAGNLTRALPVDAVVGRLGGDEFAVVAAATCGAAATAIVERLRSRVRLEPSAQLGIAGTIGVDGPEGDEDQEKKAEALPGLLYLELPLHLYMPFCKKYFM